MTDATIIAMNDLSQKKSKLLSSRPVSQSQKVSREIAVMSQKLTGISMEKYNADLVAGNENKIFEDSSV